MPTFRRVFLVPRGPLLDHLDHALLLYANCLLQGVGGMMVDIVEALASLPLVLAGLCARSCCNARNRWPEFLVWAFHHVNFWPAMHTYVKPFAYARGFLMQLNQ